MKVGKKQVTRKQLVLDKLSKKRPLNWRLSFIFILRLEVEASLVKLIVKLKKKHDGESLKLNGL